MKVCGGLTFCLLLLAPLVWAADLTPLISALRAQKFDEALKLAGDLQTQMPSDPRVLTLEGMANEGLKHKAEALNDYRSAVRVQPDYLPALKAEAQLEYAEGDPQGEATLKQIVKLDPSDQVSHAMLAAIAYRQKDCPAAIDQYRQSGEVISSRADALTQLGECLLRTKQAEQATTPLSQVVSLEPNQWRSHYNLAAAELANRQPQQAVQTLQPFLSEESIRPDILSLAAQAYETLGDTPRAISLLREAILHNPQNEANYLTFADLSFDHQSFQVGIDMLDAGLKQLPQSAKLYLARGILWGQLGNFSKAEEDFDTADRLSAGTIAGAAESLARLQNSNLDEALRIARAKLKASPGDPMLHYVKAATLKQMGVAPGTPAFAEALGSAAAAVRLKSDFAAARDLLGGLCLQEGKLQLAGNEFRTVLKQNPADQTALYHLIQLAKRTGRDHDIPPLIKQLAAAREAQRRQDEAQSRYRLVEVKP